MADDDGPLVLVRVEVNVDSLRRGEEGEVELNARIQRLVDAGYLSVLGHVVPQIPAAPVANPNRSKGPAKGGGDVGAEGSDPAGVQPFGGESDRAG